MAINFKKIQYKNFLSTGNVPIVLELDAAKTSLICGKNGSGKSTLTDAIYFALYGKAYRNITKPGIINSINSADCEVILDFSIGPKEYKIIRGMKPNKFEIYVDGSMLQQDAAVKDYQEYLETNILGGMNEKVFRQVVMISSVDYKPFMQLSTSARREIVEELLDLKIFSSMSLLIKNTLATIKDGLKTEDFNYKLAADRKAIYEQELSKTRLELKKIKDEKLVLLSNLEKNKLVLEKNKTILTDNLSKLKEQISVKQSLLDKQKEVSDIDRSLSIQLKNIQASIKLFDSQCTCPSCTRDIDESFKTQMLTELSTKKSETETGLSKTKSNLQIITDKLAKVSSLETLYRTTELDLSKTDLKLGQLEEQRKQIESSDSVLEQQELDLISKSAACDSDLDKTKISKQKLTEDKLYHEVILELLKDGGIKTKIVKQYIPVMNKIINEYLTRFGLPIEFHFDEQFNEVIKSRYRDTFVYNNFSEGEKQRIDSALLLTWRHIAKLKNTVNCNLLFLDETFDSSLDSTATEELLSIITGLSDKSSIYIISHKTDLSDKLERTIGFEKTGNFSTMKTSITT